MVRGASGDEWRNSFGVRVQSAFGWKSPTKRPLNLCPKQLNVNNKLLRPQGWIYLNLKIPGERVLEFHVSGSSSDVDACVVVVVTCRPSHVSVITRQIRTESHCGKSTRRKSHFSIVKFLLDPPPRIIHTRRTSCITSRHLSSNYRQGNITDKPRICCEWHLT